MLVLLLSRSRGWFELVLRGQKQRLGVRVGGWWPRWLTLVVGGRKRAQLQVQPGQPPFKRPEEVPDDHPFSQRPDRNFLEMDLLVFAAFMKLEADFSLAGS